MALLTQATAALALGFGRIGHSTLLGQQLDFSVVLTTDGSEVLSPSCVTAEVLVGDNPLPSTQVRSRLDVPADGGAAVLRVVTNVRIDEPVASINVAVGCPPRLSRKFVVFIDPPVLAAPPTVAAASSGTAPPPEQPPAGVSSTPAPAAVTTPPARGGSAGGGTAVADAAAAPRRAAASDAKPRHRSASAQLHHVAGGASRSAAASVPARRVPLAAVRPNGGAQTAHGTRVAAPRLKLEADLQPYRGTRTAVVETEARPSSVASSTASTAALADASGLAVEQQRIRQLEQSIQKLLADARTTQASLAALQERLREAESARVAGPWISALLALLAALLVAVALLLWRQSRLKREAAWWTAGAGADAPTAAETPPEPEPALPPATLAGEPVPARLPAVSPAPVARPPSIEPLERFVVAGLPEVDSSLAPFDPFTTTVGAPPRDMTVEELIDMEQQAEFFVVLGQDDAAIELLMSHVRHGGSTSPLAFLKLLEIYRRRGERSSYDRLSERFNRRFNAYAPEWEAAPAGHGRHLEDYPKVAAAIEAVWPDPPQAMALLESLLFRRDVGVGTFELPAYGELLFLYSQARDVAEHDVPTDTVDLLLPIGEEALPVSLAGGPVPEAAASRPLAAGALSAYGPAPAPAPGPGLTLISLPTAQPSPPASATRGQQPVGIDFDLDDFDAPAPAARR